MANKIQLKLVHLKSLWIKSYSKCKFIFLFLNLKAIEEENLTLGKALMSID